MKHAVKAPYLLGVLTLLLCFTCSCQDPFYAKYSRVKEGMTLKEVEAILGKGKNIDPEDVPTSPDFSKPEGKRLTPVIKGEAFYRWLGTKSDLGPEIILGLEKEKVISKYYWEPSL